MVSQLWLKILLVIVSGTIIKEIVPAVSWLLVLVDLAVFAVIYLMIRSYPYVDVKRSMYFFGLLTGISVLVDLGIIPDIVGNVIVLSILLWMVFGGRNSSGGHSSSHSRPQLRHKWHK